MAESNLSAFQFQMQEVRVHLGENGEPWWVARDVCEILGILNNRDTLKRVSDDWKGVFSIYTPGGNQDMVCVSEAGLYKLIFTSRKPIAEEFQAWVFEEVLPSIRKTGSYEAQRNSLLNQLVLRTPATWELRFNPAWIAEAERVTGWKWSWRVMGKFINQSVYDSFPKEIRDELDRLNPSDATGHRPSKHHQHLQNQAITFLDERIQKTLTLMEVADNSDEFFGLLAVKDKGMKQLSMGLDAA
jgi:prophage antirepressor-like protein